MTWLPKQSLRCFVIHLVPQCLSPIRFIVKTCCVSSFLLYLIILLVAADLRKVTFGRNRGSRYVAAERMNNSRHVWESEHLSTLFMVMLLLYCAPCSSQHRANGMVEGRSGERAKSQPERPAIFQSDGILIPTVCNRSLPVQKERSSVFSSSCWISVALFVLA